MKRRVWPGIIGIFVLLTAFICPSSAVYAADGVPRIDAVLVLDASNSMNASDPGKLSIEAMKMFIDMLSVSGDKVGVVSYTDQIERAKAVTAIRDAADKDALKEFVSQLKRGAYTDMTVGLDEALRMLDDAHDPTHKPMIVVLSDGNNELDNRKGKTLDDADADTARIIAEAQDKGYPIYTIGLNYDGNLNRDYIENIAAQTGGLCFETKTADELPDLLSAIFADQMEIKIINAGQITADGEFQSVDIDIPDTNIVEANITFLSNNPVEVELYDPAGIQLPFDASKAILTQSNSYSLLKIISPEQGLWNLRVRGVNGDNIKINLLYHYSVDVALELDNLSPETGETVRAAVTLLEGGVPTGSESLYQNSVCTVTVTDLTDQTEELHAAAYQNGVFTAEFVFPAPHEYQLSAVVEHPNFYRESGVLTVTAQEPAVPVIPAPSTPAATPVITPAPPPPAVAEDEPQEEAGLPWLLIIGVSVVLLVVAAVAAFFVYKQIKKGARVFTGRLVIEVTDNYTREKMAPQYRNLIEYGRRTTLRELLNGTVSPSLAAVTLMPSPTAPSHMPQLIIKCTNTQIKFKKDFMEQDAAHGITMNLKSELIILLEAENKQIKLRYAE